MSNYHGHKTAQHAPLVTLGHDAHGRQLVECPTCHEPAVIADDGSVFCPQGQAEMESVQRKLALLLADPPDPPADPQEHP